jgi:hypothetical protein
MSIGGRLTADRAEKYFTLLPGPDYNRGTCLDAALFIKSHRSKYYVAPDIVPHPKIFRFERA